MKKLIAILLSFAMLLSLTACSSGGESKATEAPSAAETASADAPGETENVEIRFSWWGSELRNNATLEAIEVYMASNPGVTIIPQYAGYDGYQEKLYAEISAGNAPTIFTSVTEWYPYLYDAGAMAVMTDAFDMSAQSPAYVEACSYNGEVYGVSTSQNGYAIMYNKTMAEEYGIEVPETDLTWDELVEIWKEVWEKSGGTVYGVMDPRYAGWAFEIFGYTYLSKPAPYMYSNEALTCTAEDVAAFIDFFGDLPEGCVLPAEISFTIEPQTDSPIADGLCFMEFESTGTFATVQSQTEDVLGLHQNPVGSNGESGNSGRPGLIQNVYAGATEAEQKAAFAFLDWFTNSEEAALILGTVRGVLPTSTQRDYLMANGDLTATELETVNCISVIESGDQHTFLPGPLGLDEVRMDVFEEYTSYAVYGYQSSLEAAQGYMEAANAVLDSYK